MRGLASLISSSVLVLAGCGGGSADIALAVGAAVEEAPTSSSETELGMDGWVGPDAELRTLENRQLLMRVVRIDLHVDEPSGDVETDTGWVVLDDDARNIDLFTLESSTQQLARGAVPIGKLTQIRLVLDATHQAQLITGFGASEVTVPSGSMSGLTLHVVPPIEVEDGDDLALTVEIDCALKFQKNRVMLMPSLKLGS